MSYENLSLEVADGVATVTITREKVLNALNSQTLSEMESAFEACRTDDAVRVVVITGAGDKAFVAGADIHELAKMTPLSAKDLAARVLDTLKIPRS